MQTAFPEVKVTDHESLIDAMPNHEKDRHVAAAAVKAGAQVIVTFNTKDFRDLPDGIEAHLPSMFLTDLLDLDPAGVLDLLKNQAAALKRPAKTLDQLLEGLARIVPLGSFCIPRGPVLQNARDDGERWCFGASTYRWLRSLPWRSSASHECFCAQP